MLSNIKYITLARGIFIILLLFSLSFPSQKLIIINNTDVPITIKNDEKETIINKLTKKEFAGTTGVSISTSNIDRFINLFLEPTDKLNITIEKNNKIVYTGDQASLHEYINEKLNIDTFGKIRTYYQLGEKKEAGALKNTSELLLVNILKNTKLSNIIVSPDDKTSIKRLKKHIKYNWLYTLFSTINNQGKDFKKEVINYYYKKYIEQDISRYSCSSPIEYHVIETLIKNKSLIQSEFPVYPVVEHTENDTINQYLPQSCQKQYFQEKYNYLEHINGHNKEYYKKVLTEKFYGE